jgi:hypothetical protein
VRGAAAIDGEEGTGHPARRGDWRFILGCFAAYTVTTFAVVLTISPYFANGWDAQIFNGAGRSFFDGGSFFDLYQRSREVWHDWAFQYPPLYGLVLFPFLFAGVLLPGMPDYVLIRVPVILADLLMGWLLYRLVGRISGQRRLARLALVFWLFNPVIFYQTAVQSHQESVWLVAAILAYALASRSGWRRVFLVSVLLSLATTLKQTAVLFFIPYVVYLLQQPQGRWRNLATAGLTFVLVFGGISLPFYRYSRDFYELVFVVVPYYPVQTQSAVVWLLGLQGFLVEQTRSSFFLLHYQAPITMALVLGLSFLALRRRFGLFDLGLMVALVFFITSKKVMGYHYPILLPFLLIYALPKQRFDLVALGIIYASWIIVSPYYAPWASPAHFVLYATLMTPNTIFFLWFLWHLWRRGDRLSVGRLDLTAWLGGPRTVLALFTVTLAMVLASLVQPASGALLSMPDGRMAALLCMVLIFGLTLAVTWTLKGKLVAGLFGAGERAPVGWLVPALAAWFTPLYFCTFTLSMESTRALELALKSWGK